MKKRIEKTVVPNREERLAKIGEPKTPKMGGITPKNIEVPEVDDLLKKLKKVVSVRGGVNLRVPCDVVIKNLWDNVELPFQYVDQSRSRAVEQEYGGWCNVGCKCPPCLRGACVGCLVDAERYSDKETIRTVVAQYRGVKLP